MHMGKRGGKLKRSLFTKSKTKKALYIQRLTHITTLFTCNHHFINEAARGIRSVGIV
ncbi:MAG: hypothetical protein UY04_C0046G0008 [Parcubacteria group bacterium GW2011_GWA2_47_7]|nr:MAG: hypothetical protein UY04_C0046G0008 [Parcubacteria group bacterium GW2011_GWA2_47_7]